MLHAFPFLPPDVDALHAQGGHDLFPHDDVTGGAQFDRGPSKSFTIGFYIRPDPYKSSFSYSASTGWTKELRQGQAKSGMALFSSLVCVLRMVVKSMFKFNHADPLLLWLLS